MTISDPDKAGKRPYSKPEITKYPLKPEEAVLGGCKISGGSGGPGDPACSDGGGGYCITAQS